MLFERLKCVRYWLIAAIAILVISSSSAPNLYAAPPYASWADDRPCAPSWLPRPLTWLVPQQVGGADFRPACRAHDNCYGAAVWSRRSCDLALRDNLFTACSNSRHPIACRTTAQTMFVLTRAFGRSSYGVP